MPAAPTVSRYNPSFMRYPIQNDRTGFKPVFLPVVLVVPYRRNANGTVLTDSDVFDVKFFISDAPEPSLVAGPFNTGLLVPQLSQYEINLSTLQVRDTKIDLGTLQFFDSSGNSKQYADAVDGDSFEYVLAQGNTKSTIVYYSDADYYDLSRHSIDVEDLPRPHRYYFVWEAKYYKRIILDPTLFHGREFCIDKDQIGVSQYKIIINHPGEVHNEMFKKTPPFYFDNEVAKGVDLSDNSILEFYRPFADILQDLFDEQTFLNGVNHVNKVPAQLIPYLSYLIGWDLPNYPGATDAVRRSVLRHAVHLQKLKGSRRAIFELFEIFGFVIDIINLWYSKDGTRLISPEDELPAILADQKVEIIEKCQIDPLVVDYSTAGFGEFEIPLVHRASGNITVSAWLVGSGPTRNALNDCVDDLITDSDTLESSCARTTTGYQVPQALLDKLPSGDATVVATAEVYVDYDTGLGSSVASSSTIPIINDIGVTFDKIQNVLKVNFDHHLDFADNTKVFLFATYPTDKVIVPESVRNLRSNRFDIRIFLRSGVVPPTTLFEFLLNFVFRLKAFHSLLRKIVFNLDILQVYNVQDWCFGEGTQLQIPPPVTPIEQNIEECNEQSSTLGYKEADLALRTNIFNALVEEFKAWKLLDGTHASGTDPESERNLNIFINRPIGEECQFTTYGQNRVVDDQGLNLDYDEDTRQTFCDPDYPPLPGTCFKGRVKDQLAVSLPIVPKEIWRCTPCRLSVGSGSYWLYPTTEQSLEKDGFGQHPGQHGRSFLGSKIRQYNNPLPYSLHYTNRRYLIDEQLNGERLLAYQRPSLEIVKDNLGFPSHRFITGFKLENDFVHPVYTARPWDDKNDDLNAELYWVGDDQFLRYDEKELKYLGNNLIPDVSSFGEHEERTFLVTHSVYVSSEESHPAITLDEGMVLTTESDISFDSSSPFNPIFMSYNSECGKDYVGGYPAVYGWFDYDQSETDFTRGDDTALAILLGLIAERGTEITGGTEVTGTSADQALFTFGSQVLLNEGNYEYQFYRPYRFDCDCGTYPCSTGSGLDGSGTATGVVDSPIVNVIQCRLDPYEQPDGTYDFNCDQLSIIPRMKITETIGVCSTRFDGSIPNCLCQLMDSGYFSDDFAIDPEGSVRYQDSYGVIYEGSWVFIDNVIDILMVVKSPHVWGEPDTGYVKDGRLYRRGIVTTTRQIIRVSGDSYVIQGEGSTQEVKFFQVNTVCGDVPYEDNFCFHLECMVTDELDTSMVCGPRWVDCEDDTVEWPFLATAGDGSVTGIIISEKQPFQWINVWGNLEVEDITGFCVTEEGTEEPLEITYEGAGGDVPVFEDGSGSWPYILPHFPFISEMVIDVDLRIIELVSVQFTGLIHSFCGDLHAVLTSPAGISITIFHRPGSASGSFGNFGNFNGNYKFVDSGFTLLPDWGDVPVGTYRRDPGDWPSGAVNILTAGYSQFMNISTKGTWRLTIHDWEGGDIGTLDSWSLTFKVPCKPEDI